MTTKRIELAGSRLALPMIACTLILIGVPSLLPGQERAATGFEPQGAKPAAQATGALVPQAIRYSGVAANRKGDTVEATFRLYAEAAGGDPIWQETQTVSVGMDGRYTVLLGSQSDVGLPQQLFEQGQGRWISVSIERAPETGRSLLASVAYAMKAADAETLAGEAAGNYVTKAELASRLESAAQSLSTRAAAQSAIRPETAPDGSGTSGAIPLWTAASTLGNSIMVQTGSGGTAAIGIGTPAPATTLDVFGVTTLRKTLQLPAVSAASAASGASSPYFIQTAADLNSATSMQQAAIFAWQAQPVGNNTATPSGSLALLTGSSTGSLAPSGLAIASNGIVSFSNKQTFPGTGTLTGLTAGAGLLGGGSTGAVSLKIDPSIVPQLGAANTFTGAQTVNGGLSVNGSAEVSGNQTIFGIGAIQTTTSQSAFVVDNGSPQSGAGISSTGYNAVMGYGNYQGIYGISSAVNLGSGPNPAGVFGQGFTGVYGMGTNTGMIASASSATGTGIQATGTFLGVRGAGNTGVAAFGNTTGVYAGVTGNGGIAVEANAPLTGGIGVLAVGATKGVDATSSASGGTGVAGTGQGSGSYGVSGTSPYTGVMGSGATGVLAVGTANGINATASKSNGIGVYGYSPYIGVSANASAANGVGLWATGTSETTTAIIGHNGKSFSHEAGTNLYFAGAGVWADASHSTNDGVPALAASIDNGEAGVFVNDSSEVPTLELFNDSSGGTIYDIAGAKPKTMVPVLQARGRNGSCMLTVDGDSLCTGAHKSAVDIESGSRQVEVYGMQSAESWVEDFGSAQLTHGRASITIDPTFAETVNTGVKYHVYLTPRGECEGLYVGQTTAGTFEVRELHHGASSVEFDYRVVARRRGSETERLRDITERIQRIGDYQKKAKEAAAARGATEPQLPVADETTLPPASARKP